MTALIPLTQGRFAAVDESDLPAVLGQKWCVQKGKKTFYASRVVSVDGGLVKQYMHRLILGVSEGDSEVDHRNHDGLDNTRRNLRLATRSQNQAHNRPRKKESSSQFKGVTFCKRKRRWVAQICVNYKGKYLGSFKSESDAARAYDRAALVAFGEFAAINFPNKKEADNERSETAAVGTEPTTANDDQTELAF